MVADAGTKRTGHKSVDPATAAKADRIIDEICAWYHRGHQALGLSDEGTKVVGQARQTLDAEVGTRAQGEKTSGRTGVISPG